jgi:hypothetical protein
LKFLKQLAKSDDGLTVSLIAINNIKEKKEVRELLAGKGLDIVFYQFEITKKN